MVKRTLAMLSLSMLIAFGSQATTTFKNSSVLASGKWVKIKVGETGVYEITEQQLRDFGFTDPSAVKVFGQGGVCPKEDFSTKINDDLEQVPALHENGKIYFYANGLTYEKTSVLDYMAFDIYKTITTNPYTADCYYFLTDRDDITPLSPSDITTTEADINKQSAWLTTGEVTTWHKKDLVNPTRSGKLFLGEDFSDSRKFDVTLSTPGIIAGTNVVANISAGIKDSNSGTVSATINDNEIATKTLTTTSDATIYKLYNLNGSTSVSDECAAEQKTTVSISLTSEMPIARVDYVALSYKSKLVLPADSSQMRYIIKAATGNTGLKLTEANATTKLWLVGSPSYNICVVNAPKNYVLSFNASGAGLAIMEPTNDAIDEFVVFDTAKEQKRVTFVSDVANQNLHALDAPDMLIITTAKLKEQAERLADYHRNVDHMDVTVVDHNDVYNEFGYGMRSAMSYRQLCRMFYDREPAKFRYLLLFGGGSFDNRGIFGTNPDDMLVTYESDISNHSVSSYTSDDFFGVMNDYSVNVEGSSALLALSIGRIPFVSVADAKTYVDKLLNYMNHRNDKGDMWKSNMLVIGEYGDDYIHTQQTESFIKNFNSYITSSATTPNDNAVNFNKIYFEAYDNVDNIEATREKFVEDLKAGQNFVLFVGHSNPTSTTKTVNFLNIQQAIDTKYEALPVIYFSSCDIGRYDSGISTVLDKLMLNPNGGVIAAISASREAYTSLNGQMTDAFAKYLGISETNDTYYGKYEKTWGRVLMFAKNYTEDRSRNRLKFQLFGDPALRVDVPHSRTHISTIDGKDATEGTVTIGAMKPVTITGYVANSNGETDTSFNGDAKITLYDSEQFYMKQNKTDSLTQRGAILAETSAKVVNGEFTAMLIAPNCIVSDTNAKPLQTTAVSDAGSVVSGFYDGLRFDRTLSADVEDTTAPVIGEFYLGDKASFRDGMTVDSNVLVHATITDDVALGLSTEQIATTAYLSIDSGSHSYAINEYALDGQNKCVVDQPIYDLSTGRHTLQITVGDLAGNVSTRTMAFFVEGNTGATLSMSATAVYDDVTFDLDNASTTDGEIVVKDANGAVKMRSEVSFPYTWNGCDSNGTRLDEGVYNVCAIVDGKSLPAKKIVVVKQ